MPAISPRQQTLRKAIEWSFDLLEPQDGDLFTQLGVFVGGFALEDAEAVVDSVSEPGLLSGIEALVDQSLLKPIVDAPTARFQMLETIREFAAERLALRPDVDHVRARHVQTYLALIETAAPHFTDDQQRKWLDLVSVDHDNLRAALTHALASGDAETAQRISGAMWRFWQMRGFLSEGRVRSDTALMAGPGSPISRLKALEGAGGLAYWQADGLASQRYYEEQVAVARALGDKSQIGFALCNLSAAEAILGSGRARDH